MGRSREHLCHLYYISPNFFRFVTGSSALGFKGFQLTWTELHISCKSLVNIYLCVSSEVPTSDLFCFRTLIDGWNLVYTVFIYYSCT